MLTSTESPKSAVNLSFEVVNLKPSPIRVLLIEDHTEQVDWVRLVLEDGPADSYRLEWTSSLIGGMNRVQDGGVDVVLLDLGLPELDGYRSYTAIRMVAPKVPIVILTADTSQESERMALLDGASDYLIKGEVNGSELREALRWAFLSSKGLWSKPKS